MVEEVRTIGPNGPFEYICYWSAGEDEWEPYRPIISIEEAAAQLADANIGTPHGFDARLAPLLPVLWYCLHLPRSIRDLKFLTEPSLKLLQSRVYPHQLRPIPIPWPLDWPPPILQSDSIKLAFAPTDLIEEATRLSSSLTNVVDVIDVSTIGEERLIKDWTALHQAVNDGSPMWKVPSRLIELSHIGTTVLANQILARDVEGGEFDRMPKSFPDIDSALERVFDTHTWISASEELWAIKDDDEAYAANFLEIMTRHRRTFQVPVVLAAPGISGSSVLGMIRRLSERTETESVNSHSPQVEEHLLDFLVTHRALASNGVGLVSSGVSNEAFGLLNQLENLLQRPPSAAGRSTWRLLKRIGEAAAGTFTDRQWEALLHSSSLTSFSEFPVGLAIPPSGSSPLAARVPITYRPIVPLTRTFQFETSPVGTRVFRDRLKVLVAECIPDGDPVGRLTRVGWESTAKFVAADEWIDYRIAYTPSLASLREAIASDSWDVLILSAHGSVVGNRTVLHVGSELLTGDEIDDLPDFVCLSACQVAPRGAGTVNVTDLLLRQGALAVLGPLVSVSAIRNSTLMMRFMIHIAESMAGRMPHKTVAEVWHYSWVSNTVNDVIDGNRAFHEWAMSEEHGSPVLKEFMSSRSAGRLRTSHIYEDTEEVLLEIAADRGDRDLVNGWLRNPGYVPESLLYALFGWPETLLLQSDESLDAIRNLPGG